VHAVLDAARFHTGYQRTPDGWKFAERLRGQIPRHHAAGGLSAWVYSRIRTGFSDQDTRTKEDAMKIFVAGATGALGSRLVTLLASRGHTVVGTTRTPSKADSLHAAGATPVVLDALDRDAVIEAVTSAEPDVVVHQLTALTGFTDFRKFDEGFAATNRLRTEGTDHLLEGIRRLPVRRIVAQSYAGAGFFARTGGLIKTEDDPFDPDPPAALRRPAEAIKYLERAVLEAEGIHGTVLRYGGFYGPGTSLGKGGVFLEAVRRRLFPIVADGAGVWSFIHIDDAATATLAAIESGRTGVYNIVDDDPAPVAEWLPALAAAIGAKPPRRVPAWLARLLVGEQGVVMMTESRGASNAKAKRELGWRPAYPSWRSGFQVRLGNSAATRAA
jgi:nucleoside-diphosphate-sugar epimerase